jgi:arsenate reductase
VHPAVISAMREVGIDLSAAQPQRLTPALAERVQLLVTMGCGDACPYVPGLARLDWELPDPKDQPIDVVRRIRDDIRARVQELLGTHEWQRMPNAESALGQQ